MSQRLCHWLGCTLVILAACGASGAVFGQENPMPATPATQYMGPVAAPVPASGDPLNMDEIRTRFDQQQREIAALQEQLRNAQQPHATPTAYAPSDPTGTGPAATSLQPKQVGSEMSGTIVLFKDGEFLNFSSPNRDFTMHLGGWVQWDNVWWNEPASLRVIQGKAGNQAGIASGAASGGLNNGNFGSLQDGEYWRRLRLVQEGSFWETGEYRFNWAFENDQFSTLGLDELWVGQNQIPVIGSLRLGHVKTPMGLEADMSSSSRSMTFMERSSYSEAIELGQNFGTGIWAGGSYVDDRITYQAMAFRPDNGNSGDFFGDGQYALQGRVTCLPYYEDQGRHLLHLGVSGGWRDGTTNLANANYIGNTVTLQARPELRDDDPAAGQAITNSNSSRMVSTGALACDSEFLMGLEMAYIRGPFSVQAEYGWNWLNNASGILSTSTPLAPKLTAPTDYMFNGGYVQCAYTLTGENRAYDKKMGCFPRYYFGNQGPYENAFLVRDQAGGLCWGRGAWEVAARYSYVDLNSGAGTTAVQGGIMDGVSLGLNWYANTNLTFNFEWVYDNRYDLPATTIPGAVSAFGARVQYSF
jgi:phosphate-selective porin OprO/OprP